MDEHFNDCRQMQFSPQSRQSQIGIPGISGNIGLIRRFLPYKGDSSCSAGRYTQTATDTAVPVHLGRTERKADGIHLTALRADVAGIT